MLRFEGYLAPGFEEVRLAFDRNFQQFGKVAPDLVEDSVDLWEINEAFAVQSIAVIRELDIDPSRVNVNGGAIALGHPIGASDARVLVTLLREMRRCVAPRGVTTLCIGGDMGIAMAVERV